MVKQIGGRKRKTARILALEASKKVKKQNNNDSTDKNNTNIDPSSQQQQSQHVAVAEHNAAPTPPSTHASSSRQPLSVTRKSSKMKRLDEVTDTSTQQDGDNRKSEDPALNSVLMPAQQLPEKNILEGVLDILQLRDTREIFSQPVDPKEVMDYYDFIEEPMDFGTMRAKLQEGLYSTLQQFEHDAFLIFNNAMRFNSSATIYFRQARAIHDLATRVFHVLKTDPKKFEHEFLLTRKRPGRKPRGQTASSCSKPVAKLRGNKQAYPGSPSSNPLHDGILPGSRDGRKVNLCKTDRRQTYHPSDSVVSEKDSIVAAVYNSSKELATGNGGISYKESLLRFVKDLGPTAHMVACQKLRYLTTKAPIGSVQDSSDLISLPAVQQGRSHTDGVLNSICAGANDQFRIIDHVSKRKNLPTTDSIGVKNSAHRGKNVFGIGGLDIHGAASKGKSVLTGDCTDSKDGFSGERTALARGIMNFQGAIQKETFPCGDTTGIHSDFRREKARGKAIDKGPSGDVGANRRGLSGTSGPFSGMIQLRDKLDLLQAVREEDSSSQIRKGKSWLGLESPADGSKSLNGSTAGITGACGKYKMDQLPGAVMGESAHHSRTARNQWPFYLPDAGTANNNIESAGITDTHSKYKTMGRMTGSVQLTDQVEPVQLTSRSQSGLTEFLHSGNRYPKSRVYPSTVVKPSSSGQASNLLPGFVSHSPGGVKEPNAPLDLNSGASSSNKINQPLEWSGSSSQCPPPIYDFPKIQPEHGEVSLWGKESQPKVGQYLQPQPLSEVNLNPLGPGAFSKQQQQSHLTSAPYMQLQPSRPTPLDQDAVLQQLQAVLAQNMQQQQPNEVNLFGQIPCPQPGFHVTSQSGYLNLLNHDVFVQPEAQQLPGVPFLQPWTKPPPTEVNNGLGPDTYVLQGPQLGPSQYLQPLPGGVSQLEEEAVLPQEMPFGLPSQGLMFDAGNFWEGDPSQNHQSIRNGQYWNSSQEQFLRDSLNPDLNLGLNRRS